MEKHAIHEFKSPESKHFGDLYSVRSDLGLVISILERAPSASGDGVLSRAFFSAALITYRRCFTSGVRGGLSAEDVVSLGEGAREFHDYLYNQANKLIAHSVNPFEEMKVGAFLFGDQVGGVGVFHRTLPTFTDEGMKDWERFAKLLANTVLAPRLKAAELAAEAAAKAIPVEQLKISPTLALSTPPPEAAASSRI